MCFLASCGSSSESSKITVLGTTVISESGKTVQVADNGEIHWKYNEDHTKILYATYGQTDEDTVKAGYIDRNMKPQEIAELPRDESKATISKTGDYVYYSDDDKLYRYDVKKKTTDKIAVLDLYNVTSSAISYTGRTFAYTENGVLKISVDGEKAKKVATEAYQIYGISDDGTKCFYKGVDSSLLYYADGESNYIDSCEGVYAVNRDVDEIFFAAYGSAINYYNTKMESPETLDYGEIKSLFLNRIKEVDYNDIPLVKSIGGLTYIKRNDTTYEDVCCRITDDCEDSERLFSQEYIGYRDDVEDYFIVYSINIHDIEINVLYSAEGNKVCYIDDETLYTLDLSKDDAEPVKIADDVMELYDANTDMTRISYADAEYDTYIWSKNGKTIETPMPAYCNQSENCFYYVDDTEDVSYLCTVDSKNKVNHLGLIIEDWFCVVEKFVTVVHVPEIVSDNVKNILFLNNNVYLQDKNDKITKTSLKDVKKFFDKSGEKASEKIDATEAVYGEDTTEAVYSEDATESLSVSDYVEPTELEEDNYAWQQDIDWREIYRNDFRGDFAQGYIFADANNDGIPEIFCHEGSHADCMYYIARDGEIHKISNCIGYYPDGSLYCYDDYMYRITDAHYLYDKSTGDYMVDYEYIQNIEYDDNNDVKACTYEINGEEVDEDTYNKAVDSVSTENVIFPDNQYHWEPEEFEYDLANFGTADYDENYVTDNRDIYIPSTEY